MDRESVERLRFDRRLQQRRGWVEASDYAAHIESLTDVSGKMTTAAELEAEGAEEDVVAPAAAHAFSQPAPGGISPARPSGGVAGDFSSSGGGFGSGSSES